jgi:hypothetical protein
MLARASVFGVFHELWQEKWGEVCNMSKRNSNFAGKKEKTTAKC